MQATFQSVGGRHAGDSLLSTTQPTNGIFLSLMARFAALYFGR